MIIEPDQHYYEDGKYVWTAEKRVKAWEDCFMQLEQALKTAAYTEVIILIGIPGAGKSTYSKTHHQEDLIIFDGVFTKKEERERAIKLAHDAHIPVRGVWLDTPFEVCLERNAARSEDRRVPEDHMKLMYDALHQDQPTQSEGYNSLIILG